jgi:uncharacterized protein (TIGR02453 family)
MKFEGFSDPVFFRDLAKKQSRDWFNAHKTEYETGFVEPMLALLTEAASRLDRSYPDCELGEPKVFRIYRDVRFSKDKSPYKTHVAGVISVRFGGSKVTETPAALYLHLGFNERHSGAGLYHMEARTLERYRAALLDEKKGKELGRLLAKLEKSGMTFSAAESLKTAPRGTDHDHPRARFLKMKGLVAMFPEFPAALVKKRSLVDWVVERGKLTAPLVRWLAHETR